MLTSTSRWVQLHRCEFQSFTVHVHRLYGESSKRFADMAVLVPL